MSDPTAPRREEFLSAFEEQVAVLRRQEEIQAELEACGSDMERMAPILDELDALSKQARHPDPGTTPIPRSNEAAGRTSHPVRERQTAGLRDRRMAKRTCGAPTFIWRLLGCSPRN